MELVALAVAGFSTNAPDWLPCGALSGAARALSGSRPAARARYTTEAMAPLALPMEKMKARSKMDGSAVPVVSERISPVEAGPPQVREQLVAGQEHDNAGQPGQDGQRVAHSVRPWTV